MLPGYYPDIVRLNSDLHIRESPCGRSKFRGANKNSQCLNVFLRSRQRDYLKRDPV